MDGDSSTHRRSENSSTRPRRVLVLAYYFPPMGLSGVQRTVKFVKYLPEFGWQPTVLTVEPRGYFAYDESLLKDVEHARIVRTRSWDPTRLFRRRQAVALPEESKRRILSGLSQSLFIPDNKIGWFPAARRAAMRLLLAEPFDAVLSTAPPYTSHVLGASLARKFRIPLVLDFRDDWIGNPRHVYPTPWHRSAGARLERSALKASSRVVVINEEIGRNLSFRNPALSSEKVHVIPQGFDPEDFAGRQKPSKGEKFTLLYSGIFYDAQTPDYFLHGLADLLTRRTDLRNRVEARFVGLVPEKSVRLAGELRLADVVRFEGYRPHEAVIDLLLSADALWMTVGRREGSATISTSKLFEYFGTRKPILGLVPEGAARTALEKYSAAEIVDPYTVPEISSAIERLYERWASGTLPEPSESVVQRYDRRNLTKRLAEVLEGAMQYNAASSPNPS